MCTNALPLPLTLAPWALMFDVLLLLTFGQIGRALPPPMHIAGMPHFAMPQALANAAGCTIALLVTTGCPPHTSVSALALWRLATLREFLLRINQPCLIGRLHYASCG